MSIRATWHICLRSSRSPFRWWRHTLGGALTKAFQSFLPSAVLALAIVALWPPLNELNEQLRLRTLALYIERQLRPQILASVGGPADDGSLLTWESFQTASLFRFKSAGWFNGPLLFFRGFLVPYAPAIAAIGYYSATGPLQPRAPIPLEVGLIVLWLLVASIPLIGLLYLALAPDARLPRSLS